ncbi:Glyco-tran-10-N domain-containing protein [Aphelenchoides besseyi]|nr:Glyco-tran-10-N domain-containing protein [Aphelenchoides besseyi]
MGYFGRPNRSEHQVSDKRRSRVGESEVNGHVENKTSICIDLTLQHKQQTRSLFDESHLITFTFLSGVIRSWSICSESVTRSVIKRTCEVNNTRDYHFYFAFENAVCDGYVTEKFYRFKKLIVPIVLRKSDYVNLVPEGSFIAVDQFDSMDALTEHLEFLMNNKDEYLKYFEWTRHYERQSPNPIYRALCRACGKLYEPGRVSAYKNMADFYSPKRLRDFDFVPRLIKRQTNS